MRRLILLLFGISIVMLLGAGAFAAAPTGTYTVDPIGSYWEYDLTVFNNYENDSIYRIFLDSNVAVTGITGSPYGWSGGFDTVEGLYAWWRTPPTGEQVIAPGEDLGGFSFSSDAFSTADLNFTV